MSLSLCFVLLAVAADPALETTPRPLYEINRQIRAVCQQDSLAKSDAERTAAAVTMTEIYREILTDPRFASSPTLKEYRARLWSRLTRIRRDVELKMRKEKAGDGQLQPVTEADDALAAAMTQTLGDQLSLIAAGFGGPASVFSQAGAAGGGTVSDYGPDLVALIQRTIQPEFWDVNGGPGTVVYYQPLHCLVVRATSEVHYRLGGTIGDLRAAGK